MIIAIDFDDTLMDTHNVPSGYRMGQPTSGAILATQRLVEQGHTIVIFTARQVTSPSVYKAVDDWCKYFGIPHSGITNLKKPEFDLIIDNLALRFDGDWVQILSDIDRLTIGRLPRSNEQPSLIGDITKLQ